MNAPAGALSASKYIYPTAFSGWGPEEHAAVQRVVQSGQFTMGAEVEALEHEFATWHGMKYGVAVNSGSSANLIAVAALFEGADPLLRGETVIVPALAWSTTYAPLIQYGLEPLICDIGDDWNADIRNCAVYEDASLILACPILGNPTHERAWEDLSHRLGAFLIVDNCESVGARADDGTLSGTRGIGNTFSFYFSHQISAIEGGMILTNNQDYANACRMLRAHGWTRGLVPARKIEDEFDFRCFGYNVRPVEMHAAVAREQLKKLPARIAARSANYAFWLEETRGLPLEHPAINGEPSFFGIHFSVDSNSTRTRLATALRKAGIDCRPPVGGSFLCHQYGSPWRDQDTPRADDLHYRGLFLGNPPFEAQELIANAVKVMRETL
jgi:CDP-6-deoxy-D-xylo-4-hexulose-3-dehydrase